jgi:hypothetical protein
MPRPIRHEFFIQVEIKYFEEGNVGELVNCHMGYIAPVNKSVQAMV